MGGDLSLPREPSGSIPACREALISPETNQQIHLCPAFQGAASSAASVVCQSRDGKQLWLQLHTRAEKPGIYTADCLACSHFAEGITRHTKPERFRTGSAHIVFAMFYSSTSHQITAAAGGTRVHGGGNKGALDGVLQ